VKDLERQGHHEYTIACERYCLSAPEKREVPVLKDGHSWPILRGHDHQDPIEVAIKNTFA
jgi:hypothetical protein